MHTFCVLHTIKMFPFQSHVLNSVIDIIIIIIIIIIIDLITLLSICLL